MKIKNISVLFMLLVFSCSSGDRQNTKIPENPIDSFESAMPHGQTLIGSELSDEDKVKLAKANGKIAEPRSFESLIQTIVM